MHLTIDEIDRLLDIVGPQLPDGADFSSVV